MYLTKEEFMALSGIKLGLSYRQIARKFKTSETAVKIACHNLFKKYGVLDRLQLFEVADLKKVEVKEENNIPFFQYEEHFLVQKIKISKRDVINLAKLFEKENDNEKEYELILNEDFGNMFNLLYLKNLENNETKEVRSVTD